MFDILAYLVEHYYESGACPRPDALGLKLKAAGFDEDDIDDALTWLSGLGDDAGGTLPDSFAGSRSFRSYASGESERLSPDCRGLIAFLESSGVIDPPMRERIIERALALPDPRIEPAQLRIVVLVVMWSLGAEPDALVFDELLDGDAPRAVH